MPSLSAQASHEEAPLTAEVRFHVVEEDEGLCTELESHVLDWLVDLMALPDVFRSTGPGGGVIQDSASSATLCALLTARSVSNWPPG